MSQSSECCCGSDQCDNTTSQSNELSVRDQNPSCLTLKVIGGLNDIRATVSSESSLKPLAVDNALVHPDFNMAITLVSPLSYLHTDDIAPPNEDICIRNSSLLI